MLGWDGDELCGAPAHATIHFQRADGSSLHEDDCEILRVRTTGEVVAVPSDAFTRKDGTILPVAYSAAPLDIASDKRGVVVVFRDISGEQAERKRIKRELDALSWVGRTRDALDDGRLILYSQPIVALRGGPPIEELLLRMIGRDGEVIPPGRFLPSAERFGLISDIDCWVAVQAIRLAASGRRVTANLSAQSIGSGELLALVEAQLRESGADPANVVFEITETGLMRDIDDGQRFAERLVELGCAIALDDFGTGFGSFTYIKRMPLMYLKIDVEFVHQLASNTANQHLVRAIVSLAQVFGQQTIAEGVDDAQTMILLREYGVDYVQGFHIGRPAPIAGFFDVGPQSRRG
jgi:PAS domain S-box-containing protein